MKTILISILTPVLLFSLLFGLVLLFTPALLSIVPAVWYFKSSRKQSMMPA